MSARLVRPRDDRWIAGVCSGLARRFGMRPNTMRLIFVLSCLLPGANVTQCALTLDCGEGRICDNQQCRQRTCAEICPANFECAPGATICSRRSCNADSDCPQRVCVLGACYDSLGFCR